MSKKYTIADMQRIARERGGECLSKEYITTDTKLQWKCHVCNNIWWSTPHHVKKGGWCPQCRGNPHYDINDMKELAKHHNGLCLSEKYLGKDVKLKWQCENGHLFETVPKSIRNGVWCPYCAKCRVFNPIQEMQDIAKSKGGECLSDHYDNCNTKILFRCANGHQWETTYTSIRIGRWCHQCGVENRTEKRKLTKEDIDALIKPYEGVCLAENYENVQKPMLFQCKYGHRFEKTINSIRSQYSWCPICTENMYIGEEYARKFCELIFGRLFPKKKPQWLINSSGNRMELDGYCEKLKIAFEYQGRQHYNYMTKFHDNETDFQLRKKDDEIKVNLCKNRGVVLIVIPYWIKIDNMQSFIMSEYQKITGTHLEIHQHDYRTFNISKNSELQKIRDFAISKGGECLTDYYTGRFQVMEWKCKRGHVWEANTNSVINNSTWCRTCSYIDATHTLEEMQMIAIERGGKCLSDQYISRKKLEWECAKGHRWFAQPSGIKNGRWCPYCAQVRILNPMEEAYTLAQNHGGKCLSKNYLGIEEKMEWECAENHKWLASLHSIKKGTWCPVCGKKKVWQTRCANQAKATENSQKKTLIDYMK